MCNLGTMLDWPTVKLQLLCPWWAIYLDWATDTERIFCLTQHQGTVSMLTSIACSTGYVIQWVLMYSFPVGQIVRFVQIQRICRGDLNVVKIIKFVVGRVKNIGDKKNTGNKHFLLSPQLFRLHQRQKSSLELNIIPRHQNAFSFARSLDFVFL